MGFTIQKVYRKDSPKNICEEDSGLHLSPFLSRAVQGAVGRRDVMGVVRGCCGQTHSTG